MKPFEYASPKTNEQVVAMLGREWGQSEILAGGTDLLALMKDDIVTPKRLINIKQLEPVSIKPSANGYFIPARMTMGAITEVRLVPQLSMLREALLDAASPQIRNMATIGGNLCQRPRCWYFRNGMGLLAMDAKGESLVVKGDNRYHAILGNDGPAKFVSPSTIAPVLIAYGATITLFGPNGKRQLPLEKFYVIPRAENEREHDLRPNEMLTEIAVPVAQGLRTGYYEVRQKEAFDWPHATCAVALQMSGDTVQSARVVLGHVAPIPWVSQEAAQALVGKRIDEATAMAAANAALAPAKPLSMNKHKVTLAKVAVKRALLAAAKGGA